MAGRERHLPDFSGVPSGDNQPATIGLGPNHVNDLRNLVDSGAVGGLPIGPLSAVDAPEAAVGLGPFVPDGDSVFLERPHVGVSAQEPEQFVDNAFQVKLFCGEQRESILQIEADLRSEDRPSACSGPV